jgi:hypothetical protein
MDDREGRSFTELDRRDESRFASMCYFGGLALGAVAQFLTFRLLLPSRLVSKAFGMTSLSMPGIPCLLIGVALLGWGWCVERARTQPDGDRRELGIACFVRGTLYSLILLPFLIACFVVCSILPDFTFAL